MLKKIIIVLLLSIIFISNALNVVKAVNELSEAYIIDKGLADYHLKYYKSEEEGSTYVECHIVGFDNGTFYPAYCMQRTASGVGKVEPYVVDVTSLIEDDRVWRAVKNGYPYSNMGLASEEDAFVVTKLAVYCLRGQSDVNLYSADDEDTEGKAMLAALKNLVEIGETGRETFTNEFNINKVEELKEDGDYYTTTYKVTSGSNIQKYMVTDFTGLEEGDIITSESGEIKNTFNSNENFKVKISKKNLNSNKNINIKIRATLKNYPMFYGKTRITDTQDYLLTWNDTQDIEKEVNLNLTLNTGKILVNKIDDETHIGIPNTTFKLYDSKGNYLGEETTDEEGKLKFSELFQGKYKIVETKPNEDYILNENHEYEVEVEYNKETSVNIENTHKKGDLIIYKVDKENSKLTLREYRI